MSVGRSYTHTHTRPRARPQDEEFKAAGARIVSRHDDALGQDIVLKIRPPTLDEADKIKEHAR